MLSRVFTPTSGAANAEPTTSVPPRARATAVLFGSSSPSGDPEGFVDGTVDADQDVVLSSQDDTTEARYVVSWFDLSPRMYYFLHFMHLCTNWYLRFHAFDYAICTPNFFTLLI
jgi:hypothetical protein